MPMRRRAMTGAIRLADALVLLFAFAAAFWVPYHQMGERMTFAEFVHVRIELGNIAMFIGLIAAWQVCFEYFGLYRSRRMGQTTDEMLAVVKATLVGTAIVAVAALLFRVHIATREFLLVFWLLSTVLTCLVRLAARAVLRYLRLSGRNLRFLLVAGTNERALEVARRVTAKPELGYRFLGFVDDTARHVPLEFTVPGHGLVTDFAGFPEYLRSHVVDEMVVCLPVKSMYEQSATIIAECREQGTMVRFLSDIFDGPGRGGASYMDQLAGDPIVTMFAGPRPGVATLVKRVIDIATSGAVVIALAPLAAAIIVAIKTTSPGPAHFVQERLGLNKRRFRMFKFRTMVSNAEQQREALLELNEAEGPVFKIRNDPRVTRVGAFLRKTSLDELPQFFNVLKGDMSLVGPRPLPVKDFEGFDEDWHRRRFSVRPGLTCLWQVTGRSNVSFSRWMELDMEYIDSWSLGLDLRILARTIPAVLRGSGAS